MKGHEGWTVTTDPGFDYPPAREPWESGTVAVGLSLDHDVRRMVVEGSPCSQHGLAGCDSMPP